MTFITIEIPGLPDIHWLDPVPRPVWQLALAEPARSRITFWRRPKPTVSVAAASAAEAAAS